MKDAVDSTNRQAELGLLSLLRAPDPVRDDVLASFGDNEHQAIKAALTWAWNHRRVKNMTKRVAAGHVGVKSPHFSNILNGKKYLPPHLLNSFEWYMGNRAVSMTIERFRRMREKESALELAKAIVESRAVA
jgi:hypothetical protein